MRMTFLVEITIARLTAGCTGACHEVQAQNTHLDTGQVYALQVLW